MNVLARGSFFLVCLVLLLGVNQMFAQDGASVERLTGEAPQRFNLEQNYPNPFNPTTNIRFSVSKQQPVALKIYNLLGEQVATLVDGELAPGSYAVSFNASHLPTGIYVYRLVAGQQILTRKMTLLQ